VDKLRVPGPPSQLRRFPLRWLGLYLGLWFMPAPLGQLPWVGGFLKNVVASAKERGAQWFSGLWPGSEGLAIRFSGGSDRTIDYYIAALLIVLSCLIAGLLSARRLDAPKDRQLFEWLRGYLRLVLACTMLLYGLCKVFPLQFHPPGLRILTMRVGDLTPLEIMWTFMGVSQPYTIFSGVAELIGGVLLLWPRTSLLGASILFVVMGNVVLLDLCYDVDMKLYAGHLLLAITFLIAPEAPRLARAFLPRKTAAAESSASWRSIGSALARFGIFALVAGEILHWSWTATREGAGRHPLHGIWKVEDAAVSGTPIAPHAWHSVAIQRGSFITIGRDHSRKLYKLDVTKLDAERLTLRDVDTGKPVGTLSATSKNHTELLLAGELAGEPLQLGLRRSEEPRLVSHRFQWAHDDAPKLH
jgi:hypothetical protein